MSPSALSAQPSKVRLVLITGVSGAGKSSAVKTFEDLGYYCIDNLPMTLLRPLLTSPSQHVPDAARVAVVTDVRSPGLIADLPELLGSLDRSVVDPFLLFLDTSDEVLIRRYSETRRKHPLATKGSVIDGISRERELLTELRGLADRIMVTTDWNVHDIRDEVMREFGEDSASGAGLVVSMVSFGFKRGIPYGSDLLFDVRYLPNPHFIEELKPHSGLDDAVRTFLEAQRSFCELRDRLVDLLEFLLPQFQQENRSYLTVSIGCTGGRHRSVAMVEALAQELGVRWRVRVSHRDVGR